MIKKNLLAIIPARGGSTGLKNKNILKLGNKPLLYYSLRAGDEIKEKSKNIICSTDSKKIRSIVKKLGYDSPFLRPKNISGKNSTDITFVNHAIKYFYNGGIRFMYGVILRPTAPFRNKVILNKAYKKFKNSKFDSMRAITLADQTPFRMWLKKGNKIKPFFNSGLFEQYNIPRQKLPKVFFQAGNFEFFKINYKSNIKSVSGKNIFGYLIQGFLSADVDSLNDLKKARNLFKSNKNYIS